jgi:dGTPase
VSSDVIRLPDGSLTSTALYELRYGRWDSEDHSSNPLDARTETERDRGRVLYSSFYQRLAGVTQIVSPTLRHGHVHNRLTHSEKVALLAREIATDLLRAAEKNTKSRKRKKLEFKDVSCADLVQMGGLDLAACEVAGIAHDIGHAPFGHNAEKYLDKWISENDKESDGFEGNAQSLRVVGELDHNAPFSPAGLNLTAVSLAALQKYPWLRDRNDGVKSSKFSVYKCNDNLLTFARQALPAQHADKEVPSLEAAIMDVADDITYAIHDLRDFYLVGVLDIGQVIDDLLMAHRTLTRADFDFSQVTNHSSAILQGAADLQKKKPSVFKHASYAQSLMKIADELATEFRGPFDGTTLLSAFVKQFFSSRIKDILRSLRVSTVPTIERPFVFIEDAQWHDVQVLKHISQERVIGSPVVGLQERSQLAALKSLLDGLEAWATSVKRLGCLPQPLAFYVANIEQRDAGAPALRRAICDYVCSFTDDECVQLASHMSGADIPLLSRRFL